MGVIRGLLLVISSRTGLASRVCEPCKRVMRSPLETAAGRGTKHGCSESGVRSLDVSCLAPSPAHYFTSAPPNEDSQEEFSAVVSIWVRSTSTARY
jgi:hypothetical protein